MIPLFEDNENLDSEVTKPVYEFRIKNKHIQFVVCHKIPSRSIHYKGKPILCYRCAAMNIGFVVMLILHLINLIVPLYTLNLAILDIVSNSLVFAFLLVLSFQIPILIDGGRQALSINYESTNFKRIITGLVSGIGQFYFPFFIGHSIGLIFGV